MEPGTHEPSESRAATGAAKGTGKARVQGAAKPRVHGKTHAQGTGKTDVQGAGNAHAQSKGNTLPTPKTVSPGDEHKAKRVPKRGTQSGPRTGAVAVGETGSPHEAPERARPRVGAGHRTAAPVPVAYTEVSEHRTLATRPTAGAPNTPALVHKASSKTLVPADKLEGSSIPLGQAAVEVAGFLTWCILHCGAVQFQDSWTAEARAWYNEWTTLLIVKLNCYKCLRDGKLLKNEVGCPVHLDREAVWKWGILFHGLVSQTLGQPKMALSLGSATTLWQGILSKLGMVVTEEPQPYDVPTAASVGTALVPEETKAPHPGPVASATETLGAGAPVDLHREETKATHPGPGAGATETPGTGAASTLPLATPRAESTAVSTEAPVPTLLETAGKGAHQKEGLEDTERAASPREPMPAVAAAAATQAAVSLSVCGHFTALPLAYLSTLPPDLAARDSFPSVSWTGHLPLPEVSLFGGPTPPRPVACADLDAKATASREAADRRWAGTKLSAKTCAVWWWHIHYLCYHADDMGSPGGPGRRRDLGNLLVLDLWLMPDNGVALSLLASVHMPLAGSPEAMRIWSFALHNAWRERLGKAHVSQEWCTELWNRRFSRRFSPPVCLRDHPLFPLLSAPSPPSAPEESTA